LAFVLKNMTHPTLRESAGQGVRALIDWAVQQELDHIPVEVRQQTVMIIGDDLAAMLSAEAEPQVMASQATLLLHGLLVKLLSFVKTVPS
jgi:hypothetical protein